MWNSSDEEDECWNVESSTHRVLLADADGDGEEHRHEGGGTAVFQPAADKNHKQGKVRKTETHKQCQTCNKWNPNEFYELHVFQGREYRRPACPGICTEKYHQRRKTRREKQAHKEYHRMNRQGDKHKAMKAKSARRFNATEKGKIVKRRADKKFRSTAMGMMHHRIQERFRAMLNTKRTSSAKVIEWTGMMSNDDIEKWARKQRPGADNISEMLAESQIDHIIPYFAFTFKRSMGVLVRSRDVSDDDMKRLWNPDNLTLIAPTENHKKGCKLPPDDVLITRQHCWPSWFEGRLPSEGDRAFMRSARYGKGV